jgi:hypothetical protein
MVSRNGVAGVGRSRRASPVTRRWEL